MVTLTSEEGLKLLKSGEYSDLSVVCGTTEFHVHKLVLCPASTFFDACVKGNFAEAQNSTTRIEETTPYMVGLTLLFLYTGDIFSISPQEIWIDILIPDQVPPTQDLIDKCKVMISSYQLADRLMIPSFRKYAVGKYEEFFVKALSERHTKKERSKLLVALTEFVFQSTSSEDDLLRVVATGYAMEYALRTEERYPYVVRLLLKYEPMAFRLTLTVRRNPEGWGHLTSSLAT